MLTCDGKNNICYHKSEKTQINRNTSKSKEKLRNINKNLKGFEKIESVFTTSQFYSKPPICCNKQDIFIDLTAW